MRSRTLVNGLLVAILYSNVSAMLTIWDLGLPRGSLPSIPYLGNLAYVHGVFLSIGRESREYVALGKSAPGGDQFDLADGASIDLDLDQYFPQFRGEAHQRMALAALWNRAAERDSAYRTMLAKLRDAFNRTHPDRPIHRACICERSWPSDPRGYYERYSERQTTILYEDSDEDER